MMKMMRIKKIWMYVLLALLVSAGACTTSYYVSSEGKTNHVSIYDPSSSNLQPEVFFYHNSEKETLMFFKVDATRMMSGQNADGSPKENVVLDVKYAIRDAASREIVDTATLNYTISKIKNPEFLTYIPLDLESGNDYFVSVLFVDRVKNSWKRVLGKVSKTNINTSESFFAEEINQGVNPLFGNYFHQGDSVRISSDMFVSDDLYLLYYGQDSLIPKPANFAGKDYRFTGKLSVDTTFNSGDSLCISQKGFYKVVSDTLHPESGREYFVAHSYYPYVKTPEAMLPPLVYITTESRFRIISKADNLKYAVDEFWLETAKSIVGARELIRVYYNRVQTANQYFTTTCEGWQTDRGMIYVLFGVPKSIYKTEHQEEWVYSENDINSSLIFRFERDTLSLSANDYRLIRDERYQQAWNQAVMTWRNGKAYSIR